MLSDSSHVRTLCSSSVHGKRDSVCDIGAASFRSIGIKITHRFLTRHLSTASNYSCFMVIFINFFYSLQISKGILYYTWSFFTLVFEGMQIWVYTRIQCCLSVDQ